MIQQGRSDREVDEEFRNKEASCRNAKLLEREILRFYCVRQMGE